MSEKEKNSQETKEKKTPVKLLKGYWSAAGGVKSNKGDIIELPSTEVKKLLKEGKAVRLDPLPGE